MLVGGQSSHLLEEKDYFCSLRSLLGLPQAGNGRWGQCRGVSGRKWVDRVEIELRQDFIRLYHGAGGDEKGGSLLLGV
jgi:hypothetical protein